MDAKNFSSIIDGSQVDLYHLQNNHLSCYITNYGARVVRLDTNLPSGRKVDVVLGFDSLQGYLKADEQYHGATVGRYANRIAAGRFSINDKEYNLAINNPPNSLHGGVNAMHTKVWDCIIHDSKSITLEYISPHLEEGFPGELTTRVTYTLKGSDLVINYEATSSHDTIINLTHHSYFNLNGEGEGDILNHDLKINADYYTPINAYTIPTGKVDLVGGTPFDFTKKKKIGRDIELSNQQLQRGFGYDHNFVVNNYRNGELAFVAKAVGDISNVAMEVWSTEPGVQLYTGNHLSGKDVGKKGATYSSRMAFCLETQHFPDSPNSPQFPSTVLKKRDAFSSTTEYRFVSN